MFKGYTQNLRDNLVAKYGETNTTLDGRVDYLLWFTEMFLRGKFVNINEGDYDQRVEVKFRHYRGNDQFTITNTRFIRDMIVNKFEFKWRDDYGYGYGIVDGQYHLKEPYDLQTFYDNVYGILREHLISFPMYKDSIEYGENVLIDFE